MSDTTSPKIGDEVLEAIASEWRFQDSLNITRCEDKSTAEVILLLEEYIVIMRSKWAHHKGDRSANEELRKITTMCLRAMHTPGRAIPRADSGSHKFE